MDEREGAITREDLEADYRPILEWYIRQPVSRGSSRAAARTVLDHGITGRYQAKVVIAACEWYLEPDELPPRKRKRAEAVLEELEAIYREMDDSRAVSATEGERVDPETPDGKVLRL